MISLRHLSVQYGTVSALADISLDIPERECVLITGPSGCGKSTFGLALCGLIPRSIPATMQGQIEIDGMDPSAHSTPEIAQRVGIVFQRPATQLFHLRVDQEVAFGARNLGLTEDEVRFRTEWALEATGTQKLRHCRPDEISGGQKQCVAIACVLAMRPRVLILDEPTSSLDVSNSRLVMETLKNLRMQHNLTIVLIEHRLAEAVKIASKVLVMDQGQVVAEGSPEEIFARKDIVRRLGIGWPCDPLPLNWKDLIVADSLAEQSQAPLLHFEQVTAGYQRKAVIRDIDLKLFPGDFAALVGENGAGKSTLGLTAAGLIKPMAGKVRFSHGKPPRPGLDVAMLFQNPEDQLLCDSVDEEVAFAPRNFGRFDPVVHTRVLMETDLESMRARRPNLLSVGQQQRTTLAACLVATPRLLILDEPTLGQDWGHLQHMMTYLAELNQKGVTILLISHDYPLIHRFARRLFVMKDGRIEQSGRVAAYTQPSSKGSENQYTGANFEINHA